MQAFGGKWGGREEDGEGGVWKADRQTADGERQLGGVHTHRHTLS